MDMVINTIKDYYNKIVRFFKNIKLPGWLERIISNSWFRYVAMLYILTFLVFGYVLFNNSFVVAVSGDFVMQEIPFYYNGYDDWWTAITTGDFPLWNESACLGVNNVGANSFYYLFNIFFLPVLLFPRDLIPQAQAFMIMTKIVLAGVGMRKLLEIFKVSEPTIFLVGMAYAFCGWNFFYLWFNHFFEIAVLMPFFLLGIEILLRKKKMLPLIFVLALVGITNYFYLITFCFTGVMYAVFRYFQRFKDMKDMNDEEIKNGVHGHIHVRVELILKGFFAFAIGLMLTSFVLIPCFDVALSNTRVTSATYSTELGNTLKLIFEALKAFDFNALFGQIGHFFDLLLKWDIAEPVYIYHVGKYYLYPAMNFFFPTVTCYDTLLIQNNGYDNHIGSLGVYTPLMLLLIPSVLLSIKEKKYSHLIGLGIIILLLFTPFAYFCFSGFTSVAYGRWQIFPTAIYCIYVAISLDKKEKMKGWFFDIAIVFTLLMQYYILQQALGMQNIGNMDTKTLSEDRIKLAYVTMIWSFVLYLYYRLRIKKPDFHEYLKYFMIVEIVVIGNTVQQFHGYYDYNNDLYGGKDNTQNEVALADFIKENDNHYYRVYNSSADRLANNLGMVLGVNGLGTFHSVFNYNLNPFLNWSQVKYYASDSSWSMGMHEKRVNLDQFLGTKYYIVKHNDKNIPFGYDEYYSTDTHKVYINSNYVELGTSYNKLYIQEKYQREYYEWNLPYSETFRNEITYLNGAILPLEDIERIIKKYDNFIPLDHHIDPEITHQMEIVNDGTVTIQRPNANGVLQPGKPISEDNMKALKYGSVVTEVFENSKVCNKASKENPCFVNISSRIGENQYITLYGENDKVLVGDNHMYHYFDDSSDCKTNRGFYVEEEVKKIVFYFYDNMNPDRYFLFPKVQFQYYEDYMNSVNEMKKYALSNVKYLNSDEFTFDTDYSKPRVVVTNVAYDKGWTLVNEKNEDIEILTVQGGFVGFLAEPGFHSYRLKYTTPGIITGLKISFIGTVFVEIYYIAMHLIDDKKRNRLFKLVPNGK